MSETTGSQTKYTTTSEGTKRRNNSRRTKRDGSTARNKTAAASKSAKPMSSFHKQQESWRRYIKIFRDDLRKAKPMVDDQPPRLDIAMLYDQEMLKSEQKMILGFFGNNPHIVKLIHLINVFGGRTDTFKFDYVRLAPTSNFATRRWEAIKIEKRNKEMKEMIETAEPRVTRVKEYAQFWKRTENIIEFKSQFPLFWKVKKKKKETIQVGPSKMYFTQYVTEKSAKYPDKRPRVFFEISIKNVGAIGKMVATLFSDYVPMTVKNFLAFCNPKAALTYKGCFFYLIFQNFFCQTGDVVENRGFGGTSIYGPYFGDEDHTLEHGERGVLTMFNTIPNRNQCQFLITFREMKTLNGRNVVFGKITRGFHVLDAIESVGSKMTGRPKVEIYISDCDEI